VVAVSMIRAGLNDGANTKIRLGIYDSATPAILNKSLEVIFERGTDIIIGPIYSAPTKIVAEKVSGKGVLVFSLSNNPAIVTEQTYVFGHAPMKQLQLLLNYALDQNYDNYITLMPEDEWSNKTNQILSEVISSRGKKLLKTEFYNIKDTESMTSTVTKLSELVDDLLQNNSNKPVIILSDEGDSLDQLLSILTLHGIDKKAYLMSDNRINVSPDNQVEVIYTGSIVITRNNFFTLAKGIGIEKLSFMHLLSYDIGRIIGENIGDVYNRQEFIARLNLPVLFKGVSGDTYFLEHIAQRHYQIIKKEANIYKELQVDELDQNLAKYDNR